MSNDKDNPGVLALVPVKFAGATPDMDVDPEPPTGVPVEGLPQSSFKEVIKRDVSREGAVRAVVDPPLSGSYYLNISLYVKKPDNKPRRLLERRPVAPVDQNKEVEFHVYQTEFLDGVHVFTYDVERVSGNSQTSIEFWALYHRDLPGGNDVPGTGDHPQLSLSLPVELGDPPQIGKDEVDKGVALTLTYPFMRPYDKITLELNRQRFDFSVQPGEESQPYVITVTREMFETAGSSARFPFSYTVVDQVNNPTHKRRWSKTIEANVDTDRLTLVAADLSEDPDDPADDPATIDLSKVKDFLYVLVHVFSPLWVVGDKVRVSYACTPPAGSAVTHSVEATVGRLPFTHKLQVPVEKVLAEGEVSVVYKLIREGKELGLSSAVEATVIGQPQDDEPPVITSVKDTRGQEIEDGGSTADVTIQLEGLGRDDAEVEIFDGHSSMGKAKIVDGSWKLSINELVFGNHRLTAKALYGSGLVSRSRTVSSIFVEDFESIPTSIITLGGTINTPFFDIVYSRGEPGTQVAVAPAGMSADGAISGQSIQASYSVESPYSNAVHIELRLKAPCSRVSFWSGSVSAPASVSFRDTSSELGSRVIPHIAVGSILYLTDFSGAGITTVVLSPSGRDWCLFDRFTFWP